MAETAKNPTENRPTRTIEDYLAAIYVMERDEKEAIAARLAETLEVAPPTVTVTLKRMERDGLITAQPRKGIHLTDSGAQAACSVIRRHMLTEWMLVRMLKVSWSQAHAEAHQIEHTISDEIEAQMRVNLDDPKLCPHGNPLPGNEYLTARWIPLTKALPGSTIFIRRIHETAEDESEKLQYLERNGIIPGAQAVVKENLPFNQTVSLNVDGKIITLGFPTAEDIFVEVKP